MNLRTVFAILAVTLLAALPTQPFVGTAEATVSPSFSIYAAPTTLANYNDAGEPSIGINWNTGKLMFQSYTHTYRVDFSTTPPAWLDVTPAQNSVINIDPILFTDSKTGRTFAGGLDGTCSILAFTDTDGVGLGAWTPMTNSCSGAGWDHQTVGGGAFAAPLVGVGYPDSVWYCSQTGVSPGPAWCALSADGGISFNAGTATWSTQCWGLHGHIKVGPDGYAYLPDNHCGSSQGGAVTANNGATWTVFNVPGMSVTDQFDPSIAVGRGDKVAGGHVYFCGRDGTGAAKVASSTNHGATWSTPVNVGAAAGLVNIEFPAMVAGDDDRASCAFLGTTTSGDTQKSTFSGVWHLYVATTYDGGATWSLVDTTPNDPVQRGCIWAGGGSNTCRNLLDFMDASIDKQGYVHVGFADGCTTTCVSGGANTWSAWASVARQTAGSPLFAAYDTATPTPPSAPTLSGTAGDGRDDLSWTTPANGGSAITGYRVYRNGALLASLGVQNTYADTTVTNGQTYTYQVAAVNAIGEGTKSNSVGLTPHASTPPSAPRSLAASHSQGPNSGKIALSWQAPSSDGGSAITNYKVYRGTTSGGETLLTTLGNVLSYTDTGLTTGRTYYYKVSAVNGVGESPLSNEASATG